MFGFLQKHHNSATTKRDECNRSVGCARLSVTRCSMKHRSSKNVQKYIYRWYSAKSKLQTTICPFTIVPRQNRLVHRRLLGEIKTVQRHWSLSAIPGRIFTPPFDERSVWSLRPIRSAINAMQSRKSWRPITIQKNLVLWHTCNRRSWRSSSSLARYWIFE